MIGCRLVGVDVYCGLCFVCVMLKFDGWVMGIFYFGIGYFVVVVVVDWCVLEVWCE